MLVLPISSWSTTGQRTRARASEVQVRNCRRYPGVLSGGWDSRARNTDRRNYRDVMANAVRGRAAKSEVKDPKLLRIHEIERGGGEVVVGRGTVFPFFPCGGGWVAPDCR